MRQVIFILSAIAILLSAALYVFHWEFTPYIFAVGAAGMCVMRMTERYEGKNIRLKRLYRMQKIASFLLLGASFLMFRGENEWILVLTITAVLELYASLMIPRAIKEGK